MAVTDDEFPPKGRAAALHGDGFQKLKDVLNLALSAIGFKMIAGLVHGIGARLGHSGPQANQATPNANPAAPGARPLPPNLAKGPTAPTQH